MSRWPDPADVYGEEFAKEAQSMDVASRFVLLLESIGIKVDGFWAENEDEVDKTEEAVLAFHGEPEKLAVLGPLIDWVFTKNQEEILARKSDEAQSAD